VALNISLLENGGACPHCGRRCRALRHIAEMLSGLVPSVSAEVNLQAQQNGWPSHILAERILIKLGPTSVDLGKELRCLAGICRTGGDTYG
jgi:hypothetical protein